MKSTEDCLVLVKDYLLSIMFTVSYAANNRNKKFIALIFSDCFVSQRQNINTK